MKPAPAPPSLRDLLLRSDFGRANPRRVDELLRDVTPATVKPLREATDATT